MLCPNKKIPDIFSCNFRKDDQNLIVFDVNISGTTNHQMTIKCFISSNVSFCTTCRKQNQQNITFYPKRYYYLIYITHKTYFVYIFKYYG